MTHNKAHNKAQETKARREDVVIRRPSAGDEGFLMQLWRDAFPEDREGGFVPWYFARCYRPEHTLLLEWQGRPAAMAYAPEVRLKCAGRTARAVYVQGVATVEELRGRGLCHMLLADMLAGLAADGVEYALLKPFDAGFYRPLGFRFAACVRRYDIDLNRYYLLPPDGNCRLEHWLDVPGAASDMAAVYAVWSYKFAACPLRDEHSCRLLLEDHRADGGLLMLARQGDEPLAYALYTATPQGIFIRELAFAEARAAREILSALAADYREDTPQAVIITPDVPAAAAVLPDDIGWRVLPFAMVKDLTGRGGGCYNLDNDYASDDAGAAVLPQPVYFYEYF
ncbi:MAG: GNAT family N-acetyltransferase [Firmicutes bacterium]|nr:GNAT family N-acetyltransferase [Bacillota bacterium]